MNIIEVKDPTSIKQVERLADEIWREHYTSIIGKEQVDYMLDKFQSSGAISDQIRDGARYYLILHQGQASAYFSFYLKPDTLFLSKVYVRRSLRGKGLGRLALEFIENMARKHSLNNISLTVNKNNKNSLAAYIKLGFEVASEVVIDIGQGFVMDDYKMVKKL